VPRAILASLLGAGVVGALLITGIVLNAPDLDAARSAPHPLPEILVATLGQRGWTLVLTVGGVSIFACALASMAGASRLLFAMGRDHMLPGARLLAAIDPGRGSPRNAILFIWLLSSLVVLALPTLDVITQISAVAGYVGYAGIVAAALWAPAVAASGGSRLAWLRRWIAAAALVWTLAVVAALTIPPVEIPGVATLHLPAISSAVGLAVGSAVYLGCIRGRILAGIAGPPTSLGARELQPR
jgi:amino acid transporter